MVKRPKRPSARTSKRPAKNRGGRPATSKAILEKGVQAVREGATLVEAAASSGVSKSVLSRALKAAGVSPGAAAAERRVRQAQHERGELGAGTNGCAAVDADLAPIDPDEDPLVIARKLLARNTRSIERLPADSPRLNPARAESRALLKLISALERERAREETPEQAAERKRRDDGDTRKEIEQYVSQAERKAIAEGVCLWCHQRLPEGEHAPAR